MKGIDKGNGVFYMEAERGETVLTSFDFFHYGISFSAGDVEELHVPDGTEVIDDGAFYYCNRLKKVFLPASVQKIKHGIFNVTHPVEIYYDGSAEAFQQIAGAYREAVRVEHPGAYDRQPYCMTQDTYYTEEVRWRRFDKGTQDCTVICKDGERLYYGFGNEDKFPFVKTGE